MASAFVLQRDKKRFLEEDLCAQLKLCNNKDDKKRWMRGR